jgi:hypothetical protein
MLSFKKWFINEDSSHPGYRIGLYPPSYGGQGLYPPSVWVAGAADAISYLSPKDKKFKVIDKLPKDL